VDGIPWPAVTASGGGWLLFGLLAWAVLWALFTGRLVTNREAEVYIAAYREADNQRKDLIATVASLTAVGKIQQKFSEVAMEQQTEDTP
jgi:hypothetical protein